MQGPVLWEYRPPRAHPILYAGILVFAFVFVTGSLENLARDGVPRLYAVYAAPLVGTLLVTLLLWRSDVRIHEHGIAPSRPLALWWHRPFLPWAQARAVYPSYYDVTGAFVSPFASSDGKVTQMGLRIEMDDGHAETVRFTPTRFEHGVDRSAGFTAGIDVVRDIFARQGRALTSESESFTPEQKRAMLDEATRPFLPFLVTVALFAAAAPVLWILLRLDFPVPVALAVAVALPLGTSLQSFRASRRRSSLMDRLAKAAEAARA